MSTKIKKELITKKDDKYQLIHRLEYFENFFGAFI